MNSRPPASKPKKSRNKKLVATPSAKHRILVPEILRFIFEYLPKRGLAGAVVVCRSWSDLVPDVLWRDLVHLRPLFSLLGSMTTKRLDWVFVREKGPRKSKWDRFMHYARRVRTLNYSGETIPSSDGYKRIGSIACATYDAVANLSGGASLLPNLRRLTWPLQRYGDLDSQLVSLLSPTLHRLDLTNVSSDAPSPLTLQVLKSAFKLPGLHLSSFALRHEICEDQPRVLDVLIPLLSQQPAINQLTILGFEREYDIAKVLESLPQLRSINFGFQYRSLEDIGDLFTEVSGACLELHVFECTLRPSSRSTTITFDVLRPLLRFNTLVHLTLNCGAKLQEADVMEMGASWRKLESLTLYPVPYDYVKASSISTLSAFAEYFPPTLRSLQLMLRLDNQLPAATDSLPRFSSSLGALEIRWENVKGKMDLQRIAELGEFLACLTHSGVTIRMYRLEELNDEEDSADYRWVDRGVTEPLQTVVALAHRMHERGRREAAAA